MLKMSWVAVLVAGMLLAVAVGDPTDSAAEAETGGACPASKPKDLVLGEFGHDVALRVSTPQGPHGLAYERIYLTVVETLSMIYYDSRTTTKNSGN